MSLIRSNKEKIVKSIGYSFRKKGLLSEALTHKSYFHENREKAVSYNERLEFLGDSVVGLIIVERLFLIKEKYPESVLAKMKSYLVSEPVLADIARSFSLGDYLMLGKGEEATGGREKQSILADALEALMGAVYLDGGYEDARNVVLKLFGNRIETALKSGKFYDYKTELQEKSQLLYGILPEYKVVREQGEEHRRIFTVAVFINGKKLGVASGGRKKEAESLAAQKAIERLEASTD